MITVLGSPNRAGNIAKFRDAFLARHGVQIKKIGIKLIFVALRSKKCIKILKKRQTSVVVDPLNP
jgi:hypothetical protein